MPPRGTTCSDLWIGLSWSPPPPASCPQCKDESIKEILVDSNKRDSYYIRRITASNNTIEVLGIKQAVEEVKELKEDITEIREEIDKLTEKQEAKIKSQNNTPNKNSSKENVFIKLSGESQI